ncbi:hypothetical protein [uncultured Lamprocystis sp.]|jgi:hypothetical protein|uniref:hypothetical protein n=1 Tax=uncultured Lamprocystis sp. TaxID=543132 RepID=UPI0025E9608C|nr:hypothetical protein [uncultured Lamprocystis sp.]
MLGHPIRQALVTNPTGLLYGEATEVVGGHLQVVFDPDHVSAARVQARCGEERGLGERGQCPMSADGRGQMDG